MKKSIKKILKRVQEEFRATYEISKITSLKKGLITFRAKVDIQLMAKTTKKESLRIKNRLLKKHEILLEYFEKKMKNYLENYNFESAIKDANIGVNKSNIIWVCWWQGIENAPQIVKKCINSIKQNSGKHQVIIITLNNYKKYVNFPDFIEKKRKKGIMSLTHFSDLLRLTLLGQYGGMWLDATFFAKIM